MPIIVRKITHIERPWALNRKYQHLLGTYVLEQNSGIYFAESMNSEAIELITATLLLAPAPLRELACRYQLTISTCYGRTRNGNSSTFYADFSQSDKSKISPHVEIGSFSLQAGMLLPHLCHELAHLWWRNLPAVARLRYSLFLVASSDADTVEVTPYAHDFYKDWLNSLSIPETASYAEAHRRAYLKVWAEESFCDTIAKLVSPDYQSDHLSSNVNLVKRREGIQQLTGLVLG